MYRLTQLVVVVDIAAHTGDNRVEVVHNLVADIPDSDMAATGFRSSLGQVDRQNRVVGCK